MILIDVNIIKKIKIRPKDIKIIKKVISMSYCDKKMT